jgi:hypothetical protein
MSETHHLLNDMIVHGILRKNVLCVRSCVPSWALPQLEYHQESHKYYGDNASSDCTKSSFPSLLKVIFLS